MKHIIWVIIASFILVIHPSPTNAQNMCQVRYGETGIYNPVNLCQFYGEAQDEVLVLCSSCESIVYDSTFNQIDDNILPQDGTYYLLVKDDWASVGCKGVSYRSQFACQSASSSGFCIETDFDLIGDGYGFCPIEELTFEGEVSSFNAPEFLLERKFPITGEGIFFYTAYQPNPNLFTLSASTDIAVYAMDTRTGMSSFISRMYESSNFTISPDIQYAVVSIYENDDYNLYLVDIGSSAEVLEASPAIDDAPTWSPKGDKIAFMSDRDGDFDIYLIDFQTRAITQLTNEAGWERYPAWSPDGNTIYYHGRTTGDDYQIYAIPADGSSEPVQLTNIGSNYRPTPSPDGTKIIFTSQRDNNGTWDDGRVMSELYMMNTDGSNQQRLTFTNVVDEVPYTWSPDSQSIIYNDLGYNLYGMYLSDLKPRRIFIENATDLFVPGLSARWVVPNFNTASTSSVPTETPPTESSSDVANITIPDASQYIPLKIGLGGPDDMSNPYSYEGVIENEQGVVFALEINADMNSTIRELFLYIESDNIDPAIYVAGEREALPYILVSSSPDGTREPLNPTIYSYDGLFADNKFFILVWVTDAGFNDTGKFTFTISYQE
jgi:dipeptidyl aminopeptidase/acylaminoacyl peptidase